MSKEKLKEILDLPYEVKLEIYEALSLDLGKENETPNKLSPMQMEELDRRLKRLGSGEEKLIPWKEIKKKYGMR